MKCPKCKNEVARLVQRPSTILDGWVEGLCITCDSIEKASDKAVRDEREGLASPISANKQELAAPPTLPSNGRKPRKPYGPRKRPASRLVPKPKPANSRKPKASESSTIFAMQGRTLSEIEQCEARLEQLKIRAQVYTDILEELANTTKSSSAPSLLPFAHAK